MCLCILCRCFSWACSAVGAMLLLCASSSTVNSQSIDIWALASKDASRRGASRWRCAPSSCCPMALRVLLQAEATHTLL